MNVQFVLMLMKKTINFEFFPAITSIMRNVLTFGLEMKIDNVHFA
ncbi:hypothetical protein B4U80_03047, partial [Leptotrombidium deliense]